MSVPNTLTETVAVRPAFASGSAARTILSGTLIAGTLDISSAIAIWVPQGISAQRVLQSVAGGLLGRDTINGGSGSAALGLLLHFAIMSVIVTLFYAASRRLPALTRRWLICGVAYGVVVYLVMTFVVLPLSASPGGGGFHSLSALVQGLVVHIVCVGLPIAFITRRHSSASFAGV
jgi:hypothetical protein